MSRTFTTKIPSWERLQKLCAVVRRHDKAKEEGEQMPDAVEATMPLGLSARPRPGEGRMSCFLIESWLAKQGPIIHAFLRSGPDSDVYYCDTLDISVAATLAGVLPVYFGWRGKPEQESMAPKTAGYFLPESAIHDAMRLPV